AWVNEHLDSGSRSSLPVGRERVVLGAASDRTTARRGGVVSESGGLTSSFARRGVDAMETERNLSGGWDRQLASEFAAKSADEALATMAADPHVNVVPLMIGGRGRAELHDFYANHFLNQIPPDMEMVPVSRTVGQGRVVDELVGRFTHSIRMDWILPGIPPTGRPVELPFVFIVHFQCDQLPPDPLSFYH